MSYYRRSRTAGGTFFFTVVTFHRRPILTDPLCREALRESIIDVRSEMPFTIDAWVLLPDHLHAIWTLPPLDADYSKRWGRIKAGFTTRVRSVFDRAELSTRSRQMRHEATIWHRRFWEHEIRDEEDYRRHMDYVHYNPVKHRLVERAVDWPYFTFHRLVREGVYSKDWGVAEDTFGTSSFGEPS